MKYRITALLIILFISAQVSAGEEIMPSDTGILSLRFKNINFMRDNEYSNPITKGYTLIGFLIQPTLVYSPASNLSLALGAQILSYSGAPRINSPMLIFSTSYRFSRNSTIILGSLDGSDKHRMDDPHFYRERLYTAYTESGLRLFTETNHIFNDVWVNWLNFIFKGDTTRESFNIGESFNYTSPSTKGGLSLEMPFQFIVKHYGGQINGWIRGKVETYYNGSAGLKLNYDIGNGRFGRVSIEYQEFLFKYYSRHGTFGILNGYASWIRLQYTYKSYYFGSYYWKGNNYYSPTGNPIYSSASDRTAGLIISDRTILTNSFYYTLHPFRYFDLFAGVDSYYDLGTRDLDLALTIHLRFDQMFTLHKFK